MLETDAGSTAFDSYTHSWFLGTALPDVKLILN